MSLIYQNSPTALKLKILEITEFNVGAGIKLK
jgi:hypothetical protein